MTNMNENKSSKVPQIVAALAACIGAFSLGTVCAWTSPVLPYLTNCNTSSTCDPNGEETCCSLPVSLDENDASWIGSLFPIGALISGQVSGIMMNMWGRKLTMISMSLPCVIGWICLLIPKPLELENASLFLVGRFLTGFGAGAFTLAVPSYVSEIAESSIQGALGSSMQLSITVGILVINGMAIDNVVSWPVITGICIIFPILMSLAMFFMPESPYYLITRGKLEEAKKSLSWLRGAQYDISKEMADLEFTFKDQKEVGSVSIVQLVSEGVYLKPFSMALALMFFQQFAGINAVLFYLQDIFTSTGNDLDPPGISAFLVCLVQVIATGVAVLVVDKFGRKILLILSAVLMCFSHVGLGIFFYMKENQCFENGTAPVDDSLPSCTQDDGLFTEETVKSIGWLPLACLIIYIFFFSIGFGPLPWAINAEIFPRESKGLSSSVAASFNWLCAFFVTFFQNKMIDGLHAYGLYFLYAACCAAAVAFVVLLLPETAGKSPEDMKSYFLGERMKSNEKDEKV